MTQAPQTLSDKQMAALLAMLVAIMPFSVDAYLPAIPAMADSLGADIHRIEQSLSTFMFGVAAGQLVGGSIADIKGRRVVALTGLVVYIASVIGLVFIRSADELLLLRMVQAFGAGMTVVVVGAIVRDNYEGNKAAQMFALIGIIMMGAPLVAPMLGAALKALGGWRLIFGFLALYAAIVWGLLYRFLAKPVHTDAINRSIFRTVAARYRHVLSTRPALGFLFFQAFSFSSMFVFLTESSFVYMNLYGLSAHAYAWVFGLYIITIATKCLRPYSWKRCTANGVFINKHISQPVRCFIACSKIYSPFKITNKVKLVTVKQHVFYFIVTRTTKGIGINKITTSTVFYNKNIS